MITRVDRELRNSLVKCTSQGLQAELFEYATDVTIEKNTFGTTSVLATVNHAMIDEQFNGSLYRYRQATNKAYNPSRDRIMIVINAYGFEYEVVADDVSEFTVRVNLFTPPTTYGDLINDMVEQMMDTYQFACENPINGVSPKTLATTDAEMAVFVHKEALKEVYLQIEEGA